MSSSVQTTLSKVLSLWKISPQGRETTGKWNWACCSSVKHRVRKEELEQGSEKDVSISLELSLPGMFFLHTFKLTQCTLQFCKTQLKKRVCWTVWKLKPNRTEEENLLWPWAEFRFFECSKVVWWVIITCKEGSEVSVPLSRSHYLMKNIR